MPNLSKQPTQRRSSGNCLFTSLPNVADKLKEIARLHVDINSLYHLLFKAIFELKLLYPRAYRMAVEYRKWLLKEIFDLVFSLETALLHKPICKGFFSDIIFK